MRVDDLLPALLRSDPARPRITCYDDETGERIELSGKVLANWVAKAANLLIEEYDAGPGTVIRLDLPPHWRTAYWLLAALAAGATVDQTTGAPDVLVTTDPNTGPAPATIVVTLAALARSASTPLLPGAIDEAKELAGYGDRFEPWERADDDAAALITDPGPTGAPDQLTYAGLPDAPGDLPGGTRVHTTDTAPGDFLHLLLRTYASDGSLVVSRSPDPQKLAARLAAEGVTQQR